MSKDELAVAAARNSSIAMKTYHVYILLCSDGSFYVGITNDIERRLAEHQLGISKSCYTYTRRPLRLMYAADFYDVEAAIRWEKQIKGWSRAKKLALINGDWQAIRRHALTKSGTSTVRRPLRS